MVMKVSRRKNFNKVFPLLNSPLKLNCRENTSHAELYSIIYLFTLLNKQPEVKMPQRREKVGSLFLCIFLSCAVCMRFRLLILLV